MCVGVLQKKKKLVRTLFSTFLLSGREVALYCSTHLPEMITLTEAYQAGNLEEALKEAFMECDHKVLTKEAIQEMKALLNLDPSDDETVE